VKPFGRIRWTVGMGVMSVFALVSSSLAGTMEFREGPSRAVGLIAATTLSQGSAPSEEKAYRYQYFPDAQVYFDPSRELYFYMVNGEWTKSPVLPREFRNRLGDFVVLETADDDPYEYYREAMKPRSGPVESRAREGRSKTSGEHAPSLSYQYYYYPREQVYFDPANRAYFYLRGRHWERSPTLPAQIREPLGDYVIIETDTDSPYTYHEQVLQMYFKQAKAQPEADRTPPAWEPKRSDPVYRYLYYPAAFFYFDEDRHIYFYYNHDQWLESSTLPAYLSKNSGDPVELRMNTPQPYQFHTKIIEKYPHPGVEVNKTNPIFQIWSGHK
jgi:hypothetical protein